MDKIQNVKERSQKVRRGRRNSTDYLTQPVKMSPRVETKILRTISREAEILNEHISEKRQHDRTAEVGSCPATNLAPFLGVNSVWLCGTTNDGRELNLFFTKETMFIQQNKKGRRNHWKNPAAVGTVLVSNPKRVDVSS